MNADHVAARVIVISQETGTISEIYHKSSFIRWSKDWLQFKILSAYHVTQISQGPYDFTRTENYSLSAGNLVIDRITVLPDATQTSHAVYDKK